MEAHRIMIAAALVLSAPAFAQWLNYPTPGIPRTPDGKPNLTAPAPKTPDGKPDLSGIWMRRGNYLYDLPKDGVQVPFQPWARAVYMERRETESRDKPAGRCLPRASGRSKDAADADSFARAAF